MFEILSLLSFIFSLIILSSIGGVNNNVEALKNSIDKLTKNLDHGEKQSFPSRLHTEPSVILSPHGDTVVAVTSAQSSTSSETFNIAKLQELKAETVHINEPDEPNVFMEWIQKNFLIKLGSLFLILGFGWFMTLAISNNWISPPFQILLAVVIGSCITIGGLFMSSQNSQTSSNQIFILTGTVINILAFFISSNLYDILTKPMSLTAMVVTILLVGTLAIVKDYKKLAFVFQFALFVVPLLSGNAYDSRLFLGYYGILIASLSLGVNFWKHWSWFNTSGFLLSFAFAIAGIMVGYPIFAFVYIAIYFLSNFIPVNKNSEMNGLDLFNVCLSSVLSLILILICSFETPLKALIIIGFGLMTSLVAALFAKREVFHQFGFANMMASLFSFGIASLLFYGLSSIINLWIVAALILAGVFGCRYMARFYETPRLISFLNLMLLPLGIFYLGGSSGLRDEITTQSIAVLSLSYLIIALLNAKVFEMSKIKDTKFSTFYYSVAGLSAMVFTWYFADFILGSFSVAMALFIYAFVGLAFLYNPYFATKPFFKIASYILLGFTIGRLFLIDLWLMDLPIRIVTIIAIGVMFLATAFIKKKA
jgi:Predicted membrane protein (DUF2339)